MEIKTFREVQKDFFHVPGFLGPQETRALIDEILILGATPQGFHQPSLRKNRFGASGYPVKAYMGLGLYWDPQTYLYEESMSPGLKPHPIPESFKNLGRELLEKFFPQHLLTYRYEAALVNYYKRDSKGKESTLGLHRDQEEQDLKAPVIGISLGSEARFIYQDPRGEIQELRLKDGDAYLFGESSRLLSHGVARVYSKTLPLHLWGVLQDKERISVTLRKVKK